MTAGAGPQEQTAALRYLSFDDNSLLPALFGEHDRHLARIEQQFGVVVTSRGNQLAVSGPEWSADAACRVLNDLYARLQGGLPVTQSDVDAALRIESTPEPEGEKQTSRSS